MTGKMLGNAKDICNTTPRTLPATTCNIPMPANVVRRDQVCDSCIKEDVCTYKKECGKAINDIAEIRKRTNVFLATNCSCQLYAPKTGNITYR